MTQTCVAADVSASLAVRVHAGEIRLPSMRSGYHFDVVFRGTTADEARRTVLDFAQELAQRHVDCAQQEDRAIPALADVYFPLHVTGVWKRALTTQANGATSERLLILADGWAYQNLMGDTILGGTLAVRVEENA